MTRFTFLVSTVSIVLTGILFAAEGKSQSLETTKIILHIKESTVGEILNKLEQQSDFTFSYSKKVSEMELGYFQANSISLAEVLKQLTAQKRLKFTQLGTLIAVGNLPVLQKNGGISGKIVDERGGTLPGASIKVLQTNQTVQSKVDGSYHLTLAPGTYTLQVSYISFQTQQITNVVVRADENTILTIAMLPETTTLNQIVVTSGYKKASASGLLAQQKNAAGVTNGISAEQISATPDKNVGEVLKRISGISTTDNRRVVVRGIAERYNVAMLDGATLPSTDVQVRDFEFDIIPSNLIEDIVVSKSYTPDMSFGFGGGLIQISTMAVPTQNFTTFNFGTKYNENSTGEEFLGYGRGKYDYLGFDDGSRKAPFKEDLFYYDQNRYNPTRPYINVVPPNSNLTPITLEMARAQNKKIGGTERLGTRVYKASPGQNYQLSLGRSYDLKAGRFGFVASASYRNEQNIDDIGNYSRGKWLKPTFYDSETNEENNATTANQYGFNTTLSGLVNFGWKGKNHSITARNFYSRVFQNQFMRITGWGNDLGFGNNPAILENESPKFLDLLQNKITGQHKFGQLTVDWNLGRNNVNNNEYDAVEAFLFPYIANDGTIIYSYLPNGVTNPGVGTLNRAQYLYNENNLMADIAFNYQFKIGKLNQKVKTGYQYIKREGDYNWNILPIGAVNTAKYSGVPIQHWAPAFDLTDPLTDLYYYPASFSLASYKGKNTNGAYFAMMDNQLAKWLRVVWGGRVESYVYEELESSASDDSGAISQQSAEKSRYVDPNTGEVVHKYLNATTEEQKWRYLPSVNITASPIKDLNIRTSYAKSVVRPSLIENSSFSRYNPTLGRIQRNVGVLSTVIDHYDARIEWYPNAGEVFSIGYFYKYFQNPVETYLDVTNSSQQIEAITGNSDWAKVGGWEFDMRKNLGFIYSEWKPLQNIFLSANLTVQQSEVQASTFQYSSFGYSTQDKDGLYYSYRNKIALKEKRPLYGQVPFLMNLGIIYQGSRLSVNVVYNHMGYKTFTVGARPEYVEYERPRSQMDAQIGYSFLKNKALKVKLNMSNLLDNPYRFYTNGPSTYKTKPGTDGLLDLQWSERYEWKYGFSEKYQEGYYEPYADGKTKTRVGDIDTFYRKVGTSFSLSVSHSF